MIRRIGWFLAFFLTSFSVLATGPGPGMRQLIHQTWIEFDDIKFGAADEMLQSQEGYLWVMTESGPARFDGHGFRLYTETNTSAIKSSSCTAVAEGDDGSIWIGTSDGLLRFDGNHWYRFGTADGLPDKWVIALACTPDGAVWAGTRKGLVRISERASLEIVKERANVRIFDLHVDNLGRLWIATTDGLCVVENNAFRKVSVEDKTGEVRRIQSSDEDSVLFVTERGVFASDGRKTEPVFLNNDLPGNARILSVCLTSKGELWLGTHQDGIFRRVQGRVEHFGEPDGLTYDEVHFILEDREGLIWVGTGQGLNRFRNSVFQSYTEADGLPYRLVMSVVEDHAGNFWVGTQKGVVRWGSGGAVSLFLEGQEVSSLFPADDGRIWAGTRQVQPLPESKPDESPLIMSMGSADPLCFGESSDGVRWVGTLNGLFCLRDGEVSRFSVAKGLPNKHIRDILPMKDGSIWVGTDDGIAVIRDRVVRTFDGSDGLPGTFIFELFRDSADHIWVGTDVGLALYRNDGFVSLTVSNGLPSADIYGIQEDDAGMFWISHGSGVFSVERQELLRCVGTDQILALCAYTKEDGLPVNSGLGGNQPVTCKTSDGRIWFATGGGLASVDPHHIPKNDVPPTVVVERVLVDGMPVSTDRPLNLKPGWRRLSIRYAGLSFMVPDRVRYRQMLTGYDREWTESADRTVSYTNLPPDDYTFLVYACNNDGVWSETPAELIVHVITPWWRTWWFLGVVIILAGIGVNGAYRGIRKLVRVIVQWQRTHVFGPYRILEQIGKGGMGTVYRAADGRNGEEVALKIVDPGIADGDARKRFEREGMLGEKIRHPNVVRILDRGSERGSLYYAMEYCDGTPLRHLMEIGLGIRTSIAVAIVLIDVLCDLHAEGVVHRDVKPENIMIQNTLNILDVEHAGDPVETLRSHVKLLDFGVARVFGATTLTRTGLVTGTLQYVPPEALNGSRHAEPTVDLYAVGVMLYEMITGVQPFEAEEPGMVMYAILYRSLVPPVEVVPTLPKELSHLVTRLVEKELNVRLTDPEEIRTALRTALDNL